MFYFLPPKNPGPVIFPAVPALDNRRNSMNKLNAVNAGSVRSGSVMSASSPMSPNRNSISNKLPAQQQQAKLVVLSFTPPASFEDLLDEGYVDAPRGGDKRMVEVITKAKVGANTPTKPQAKPPSPKKKGVKIAEDNNAQIPNQKEEALFQIDRKEDQPITRMDSCLSAELRPNAYPQDKASSMQSIEDVMVPIRVFVPHKKGGVHKVTVSINGETSGNELIRLSLELYKTQTGQEPLVDDFRAYLLRVADDDGSPNSGWPVLDKKVSIKELSCDQVVLMLDKNYKPPSQQQKTQSAKSDSQSSANLQQLQFLGDIRLEVYTPSSQLPKFVPLSPDVLLKDLLKVLCTKFDLDSRFHDLMQLIGTGGDMQLKPIAKHLKDKTMRVVGLEKVAVVKTVEDDPNDNKIARDKLNATPAINNRQSMVLPSLEPDTYTEYIVVKINRFGQRQERRLGIAPNRIYNKFTVDIQSFFKRSKKTKHPERNIDDLISVQYSDNSRAFTLEFTDEVLYYEAKTVVEAAEICKKLTYYLQLRQQQRQAQNKRATRVLQPLFQQQFLPPQNN